MRITDREAADKMEELGSARQCGEPENAKDAKLYEERSGRLWSEGSRYERVETWLYESQHCHQR